MAAASAHWLSVRKGFFIAVTGSFFLLQILFLGNMSYLYGSLHGTGHRTSALDVLMVDYDGGVISQSLRAAAQALASDHFPTVRERLPAEFGSPGAVREAVCRGDYWAAVVVSPNASSRAAAALRGGAAAGAYDPSEALTLVWNQVRYAVVADAAVYASMQRLFGAAQGIYQGGSLAATLPRLNTSDAGVRRVMFNPIGFTDVNLSPASHGARVLYNTASVAMFALMQFFFVLAIKGIADDRQLYDGRVSIWFNILLRLAVSVAYTLVGSLVHVGYIWAFKEDWAVDGSQLALTWMLLWLAMHVNFLVIDTAGTLMPNGAMPFFTLTWIICNITSTITPLELSSGFYQLGYFFPAHSMWEVMIQIWSRGCYNRLSRALPILFAWEAVALAADVRAQLRKGRLGAREAALARGSGGAGVPGGQQQESSTEMLRGGDDEQGPWLRDPRPWIDARRPSTARTGESGSLDLRGRHNPWDGA